MTAFLITFKPASENRKQGWPLKNLQDLAARLRSAGAVSEDWRFKNRKDATLGDKVFLLLQGKGGPAIIGYGRITGQAENRDGQWRRPITFDALVDPTIAVLADRTELPDSKVARRLWRTQSSGVKVPDDLAERLETLLLGRASQPIQVSERANPDWTRDELILALSTYLMHRPNPPGKDSNEIRDLSELLHRLGVKLFPHDQRSSTFRNSNGVYMKLMNFRRLDPQYTAGGRKGLTRGAKAEEEVWDEFAGDPQRCFIVADAIISSIGDPGIGSADREDEVDNMEEAPEGRLLTRMHIARERNRMLVDAKRKQVLKKHGRLTCEVCGFDYQIRYGTRGAGFVECHHIKPVATLAAGNKTHINDLALVCANCHRMIHRAKPWLSLAELKGMLR